MHIEAEIYRQVGSSMRRIYSGYDEQDFIKVGEVKRLLEEAHENGRQQGLRKAQQSDF